MSYTDEEIQMHIAQEQSRYWHWATASGDIYKGMRIIDSISHRGTGKIRGDRGGSRVRVDKEKWREMGRRRRGK